MLGGVVEKLPRLGSVQLSNVSVFSSYRASHSVLHFKPRAISISTQLRQRNPQLLAEVSLKILIGPVRSDQDRRREDAHIIGYYAPATGGRAKSRSPAQGGCGSSDPMREAGVPSTGGWVVPAPPGVVMFAPPTAPRNAERAQSEGPRPRG